MNKLKHAVLMLALLVPAAVFAQPAGRPMGGARHMPSVDDQLGELSQKLSLTDAQKPQVKAILQDQRDQMKQAMDNSSGSREDNMSKMREIHEKASGKIREVLTDEQKTKYDKLQEERRKRMEERRRGGDDNGPPPAAPNQR